MSMPYKDKEKKKENHKRYMREIWYPKNKKKHIGYIANIKSKISDYIFEYKKSHSCMDCGFLGKDYPEVLEFDHLRDKKFAISMFYVHTSGFNVVKREMEKCDIVCSNCHRIRTAKRRKNKMSA